MVMDWIKDRYKKRDSLWDLPKQDLVTIIQDVGEHLEKQAAEFPQSVSEYADPTRLLGSLPDSVEDTVGELLRRYDEIKKLGPRLKIEDIVRLSQTHPAEARQEFIDYQLRTGTIPSVPPTRGEVAQGGSEIESPEDWWKRNKGTR